MGACVDADEHAPLQVSTGPVADDLGACQVGAAVKHLDELIASSLHSGAVSDLRSSPKPLAPHTLRTLSRLAGCSHGTSLPTSTSQWYTEVAVTRPNTQGETHFQNSTLT